MVIFLWVSAIQALIIILLLCRITLGFTLNVENTDISASITIYLFGAIPVKITVFPRKNKKSKSKKNKRKANKKLIKPTIKAVLKHFNKSLKIKEFILYIKLGTGDASHTAVLYGAVWNLAGMVLPLIFNNYEIKKKEVKIEPDFKEMAANVNFNCIFSLKTVNIILMIKEIVIFLLKNRKGGGADVRTSNRRSNDYSNAKYQGNG